MNFSNLGKLASGPEQGLLKVFLKGRLVTERKAAMFSRTIQVTRNIFGRVGMCLLGTAAFMLPPATPAYAEPVIIRGIPNASDLTELRLTYLASFPNGSFDGSVDKLNVGPMVLGDPLIPDSNPTYAFLPGEILLGISRPVGLDPNLIPSQSVFATPVHFGPGSISRIRATFIAPVGPYATTGGFAIGLIARTGGKDDLDAETKVAVTVNARPNQVVRFQIPFGSVEPRNTVLPQAVKDAIYSTSDPQPFTVELTIDRNAGTGTAKLMVIDQVFSLSFTLADFLAESGPTITAVGSGIAVNANAPGQTASVHVRDFRIYANGGE
jgi:hypothetical protein